MTTLSLIKRIVDNHAFFQARHKEKSAKERAYYDEEKEYIQEL